MFAKDVVLTQLLNGRFNVSYPSRRAPSWRDYPLDSRLSPGTSAQLPDERPSIWEEFLAGRYGPEPGLGTPASLERGAMPDDEAFLAGTPGRRCATCR